MDTDELSHARRKRRMKTLQKAALEYFAEIEGAAGFAVPLPGIHPPVYVAVGEAEAVLVIMKAKLEGIDGSAEA